MNVNHLILNYGYLAVFALVAAESLGVPLPGETILIAAGTYAGSTHKLSVWLIFIVAAAAAVLGNIIGYAIGVKGGYRLLRRYGRYLRLDEAKLKVGRYVFDRHGGKVVFLGRFVAILRTYAAFLAGTNKMPWHKFVTYTSAGCVAWAGVYAFASYYAGNSLKRAHGIIDLVLGVVAGLLIATVIVVVRRQARRLEAKAAAAYPGPLTD
jgi:membrane protein DedA with SNARE-associated domain